MKIKENRMEDFEKNMENAQETGDHKKKKSCKWLWWLLIPLGLILTFIIVVAALLLGPIHKYEVSSASSKTDLIQLQGLMSKISGAMLDKDGKMAKSAQVNLNENELRFILTSIRRYAGIVKGNKQDFYYQLDWRNKQLIVDVCYPWSGFGINFHAELLPRLNKGKLSFQVNQASVGRFLVPAASVKKILDEQCGKLEKDFRYKLITGIVNSAEPDGNGMKIVFSPRQVNSLFLLMNTP